MTPTLLPTAAGELRDHDGELAKELRGMFLADVATHEMQVLQDQGLYRHLRFRSPEHGSAFLFDIITWPGALCIEGDMGCYVFSRLQDMFKFFRADKALLERLTEQGETALSIKPGYWAEKLQSATKKECRQYEPDIFRERIRHEFDEWCESEEPADEAKAKLWEEIESEILIHADDGEFAAIRAACDFESEEHGFSLPDFFENDCTRWQHHYLWCCFSIAWGIQHYDAEKARGPHEDQ